VPGLSLSRAGCNAAEPVMAPRSGSPQTFSVRRQIALRFFHRDKPPLIATSSSPACRVLIPTHGDGARRVIQRAGLCGSRHEVVGNANTCGATAIIVCVHCVDQLLRNADLKLERHRGFSVLRFSMLAVCDAGKS
jgi:hypothetical protein